MDISEFAVAGLEGPLLMGVEVAETDVVDDHIFDEGVAGWGKEYRSMQICMLISWPYLVCASGLSSGMKYFLIRSMTRALENELVLMRMAPPQQRPVSILP